MKGKLAVYLLIESDFDNKKTEVTNLGQFNQDSLAISEAEHRVRMVWSRSKIVKIDRGAMIDIETGETYCESDEVLVIHSK